MALRFTLARDGQVLAWASASDRDEDALVALLHDLSDDGPADVRVQGGGELGHAQLLALADRLREATGVQPAPWRETLLRALDSAASAWGPAETSVPVTWSTAYDTAGSIDDGHEEFITAAGP